MVPRSRAAACGGELRQRVSLQEFVDLHPNRSCAPVPVSLDPCGARLTLASEGVELEFRCPTPSESSRLVLSTQQKFLASPQFLVLRRGEERTLALNTRSSQGAISFNFSSLLSFAMKRKQKRFLQMTLLFMVALIFLPNIGLWSLYKEKHLVKSTEPGEQQTFPLGLGDGQFYAWTDGLRRKDWHDYESIQKEAMRSGKGEHGKPYPLTEEDHDDSAYRENGFNIFVSNNIALERSLPDIRHANCKHKMYLERLPNTSIIIPFHNEGWTSLLRTIHSIINRTPESLIAEIILVDDFSDREHLKDKLEEYMARFSKVRIVRTKKREGLIRTRLLGASMARGEVLTFLDSHCEVNVNWLPPLLNQIALNHKTIVCPMIDVIDHNHFGYEAQAGDAMRGAFDWEMYYKRIPIPPELQRADPSDPFESPVMAGGLFAVDRKWFWELGGYDPGLEIWGGEQYEISFKVWMCGGEMFDVPCSRVGHIYRKYVPYKVPSGTSLARIRNVAANLCVDSKHGATGTELRLDICVKDGSERTWSHEQLFTFGWREDIRPGEPLHTRKFCFDAISHRSPVTLYDCHGMKGNQLWGYRKDRTLFHPVSNSCVDCNPAEKKIFMARCDPLSETQQWIFEHINMTVLDKFNHHASS
ncbi:polypeptide N-acetylgalactosaminyltransferase-like 6 isoform X2 [Ailuropoda melanoleuca]|uniref:polypeptide N-acetylgalactosaminyltransferase-like 6 isoform X2 n=1 Tax=Ailuropoda melanoleuca TaxID=9646 RepID=UPI001494311C|nr:polypeptide N-acetylgalactosaminyltransferase-like 6 isoform X2 [Ailuropoda melanoleuca]